MFKKDIRKIYADKRNAILPNIKSDWDEQLFNQFKNIPLVGINCVHSYLPIISKNEINTVPIINYLLENNIQVVVPKSDFNTNTISHYSVNTNLKLEINKWGIDEPHSGDLVEESTIDLVIVPLLGVDKRGYRVGYGKGFYDNFLANCKANTLFIGLSYFEPVDLIEDVHDSDVKIHKCVCPNIIYDFG